MTAALATQPSLRDTAHDLFQRNCRALDVFLKFPELDFCLGRDGTLTAKRDGQWLAGCSVPRRAAEMMVKPVAATGQVVCLLLPTTAYQIQAVLNHLSPVQSIIAVLPNLADLPIYLSCVDLTDLIERHRIFFTDETSLRNLFDTWPGLAAPLQMVRLPDVAADRIEAVIKTVQSVLAEVNAAQLQRTSAAREQWTVAREGIFVHCPQRFELWNDSGAMLAKACDANAINTNDASMASPAWIAERAAGHAAMVTMDMGRADRSDLANAQQPWITWITKPRVPAFVQGSPRDGLLLADESFIALARDAGWPAHRMAIAAWPSEPLRCLTGAPLALIADVPDLDPPKEVTEYSSWRVVWEAILEELTKHPLAVGDHPQRYLDRALVRLNLPSEGFPTTPFLERLLPGAFMTGLAHLLVKEGIPLAIFGRGWDAHATLAAQVRGPIESREEFGKAIAHSSGLIDPFLTQAAHPIRSLAVPRLRVVGTLKPRLLTDARAIIAGRSPAALAPKQVLSRAAIDALLIA